MIDDSFCKHKWLCGVHPWEKSPRVQNIGERVLCTLGFRCQNWFAKGPCLLAHNPH